MDILMSLAVLFLLGAIGALVALLVFARLIHKTNHVRLHGED